MNEATISVTLGALVASAETLRRLALQPLTAAASFALDDVFRFADPEFASFDATQRRLCARYNGTEKVIDGRNFFSFPARHRKIVEKEQLALMATVIRIPVERLKREDISGATLSREDVRALAWLFAEVPAAPPLTAVPESDGKPAAGSSRKAPAPTGAAAGTRETRPRRSSTKARAPGNDVDEQIVHDEMNEAERNELCKAVGLL